MNLFLLAVLLPATAQKHVYEDLLVLYVDEDYEKCLGKAEGYTLNDATRKDPLPYLYMSMSLFEMSKVEKFQEDYPKASREALKYAEKYRKKDKDNEFFDNYEDYWSELNTMAMEQGENYLDDPKGATKARQTFDYMIGYYPENPGAWLMLAMAQYSANLAKEGDLSVSEYEKALAAVPDMTRLPADQKKLLKNALIRYSTYQEDKGMKEDAKKTIEVGKDLFMEEPDFKLRYDDLH